MNLEIKNLLPVFFDPERKNNSEIWGKDLVFTPGERIKIVAPSGSGKSSLINFLYGMRSEYSGEINFGDANVGKMTIEDMCRHRKDHISIVFQDLRLFADQTALENIEIKRQLNPYHPPDAIHRMAARLGIADKLNSRCGTCSYGEQQRIAIVRSLMQPFDFLLLDEPFSHLDNRNAQLAMDLMLEEASQRKACIVFADLERIDYYPYTRLFHL